MVELRLARSLAATKVHAHSDSQLVLRQFTEEYQTREEKMIVYLTEVKTLATTFEDFVLEQIDRENNSKADSSKLDSSKLATT